MYTARFTRSPFFGRSGASGAYRLFSSHFCELPYLQQCPSFWILYSFTSCAFLLARWVLPQWPTGGAVIMVVAAVSDSTENQLIEQCLNNAERLSKMPRRALIRMNICISQFVPRLGSFLRNGSSLGQNSHFVTSTRLFKWSYSAFDSLLQIRRTIPCIQVLNGCINFFTLCGRWFA